MTYLGTSVYDVYKYNDYLCVIAQRDGEYFCGYVCIPKNHPLYKKHYTDDDFPYFEVHGGITFSDAILGNSYAIGFDCNHMSDDIRFGGTPKDKDFVLNELKSLAEQVKNYEINE